MSEINTGYSELRILLKEIGINFTDSGDAEDKWGKQVTIVIKDNNGDNHCYLSFDIDEEGNETFVCQE